MQHASVVAGFRRLLTALLIVPVVVMLAGLAIHLIRALALGFALGFQGFVAMSVPGVVIFTTGGTRWLARVCVSVLVALVLLAGLVTLYQDVGRKARLPADQGTLQAMRSAIANYYGQHGTFPDHPGNYSNPAPPIFQCVNLAYSYSSDTGELKITSTNTYDDCP